MAPSGKVFAVGTPLSQGDLFTHLCDTHPTLEIPLTPDVWPDRFPPDWIQSRKEEYRKAGMLREWKQEFELILADSETRVFDTSKVSTIPPSLVPDNLTYYCTLDGAFSESDSADYSAFTVVGIDDTGRWYAWAYAMRAGIPEVIDKLFELQSRFGFFELGIEKGAFRLAVQPEIDRWMNNYQQWFNINELSTTGSKLSRIKALSPLVNSGRLTIIDNESEPNGAAEMLIEQMELIDHTAILCSHDDCIDALSQQLQMPLYVSPGLVPSREDYEGLTEPMANPYL